MALVRTSKHSIDYANIGKRDDLRIFIAEYRRVASIMLDDIWDNGYKWTVNEVDYEFNIHENRLYCPTYIDYNKFAIETTLTARALSTMTTQLSGVIKAEVEKQRKRLYMLGQLKIAGKTKQQRKALIKKIKQNIPVKPCVENLNPELSSKCSEFIETEGHFGGFLRLKAIFNDRTEIFIPIMYHKHSRKLMSRGTRMTSFLISNNFINVRWSIAKPDLKEIGATIGADQGLKDILTCSDKQVTPKSDKHGHCLQSILETMCRKRKGSKAFKRSQSHRENYINWSINQLNLTNVKELRFEEIWNIGFKSKQSRILSHWTNTIIRDKVEKTCEEGGVLLTHMSSTYNSQRCNGCGVVRKANRKGKIYACKRCGHMADADYNACCNIAMDLPEVPYELRKLNLNRGNGFLWLESGFFDLAGGSLESPPPVKPINVIN